ncbi:MAG: hypothetical protein LQ340_000845 [Diploschistes diacapsis]|nr:MAG: hypothetical protein LQ340_000845 [Diploschistes diacapsis]
MAQGSTRPPAKTKAAAIAQPSASVILLSPTNQILLLHRVRTSSAFPSAYVFPGGNLSEDQDGSIPSQDSPQRHIDSGAYRRGVIRECFEESGILLAKSKNGRKTQGGNDAGMLNVPDEEREKARKKIHAGRLKFAEWIQEMGGEMDTGEQQALSVTCFRAPNCDPKLTKSPPDGLLPFTRWVTPTNMPKRFTTQMYLYFLPLARPSPPEQLPVAEIAGAHEDPLPSTAPPPPRRTPNLPQESPIPIPTSDGGIEHTTATFRHASTWLSLANPDAYPPPASSPALDDQDGPIILFPPQLFLLHLISFHLPAPPDPKQPFPPARLAQQRRSLLQFLKTSDPPWADKCISPTPIGTLGDGRSVLGLERPGQELEGSGRRGESERAVVVDFQREGPRRLEVWSRPEVEKMLVKRKDAGRGKL